MATLFQKIRFLAMTGRYVVSQHAAERLDERGILEWQIVDGIEHAMLLAERPDTLPNPSVETAQLLADGSEIKAVWAYVKLADIAKLVTVYFINEPS